MEPRVTHSSSTLTEQMPVTSPAFAPPGGTSVETPVAPVPVAPVAPVTVAETQPITHEHVVVATRRTISPSSVVAAAAAIVLMLWGAVVVARAGLSGDLDTPIVQVTTYTATAVLGLIVLGGGFVLLLSALARSRGAIAFVSILMAVAAGTLVIEPTVAQRTLAGERDFGIAVLIVVGITALVALVSPDVDRIGRRERID